jgi:hypothetical protein
VPPSLAVAFVRCFQACCGRAPRTGGTKNRAANVRPTSKLARPRMTDANRRRALLNQPGRNPARSLSEKLGNWVHNHACSPRSQPRQTWKRGPVSNFQDQRSSCGPTSESRVVSQPSRPSGKRPAGGSRDDGENCETEHNRPRDCDSQGRLFQSVHDEQSGRKRQRIDPNSISPSPLAGGPRDGPRADLGK